MQITEIQHEKDGEILRGYVVKPSTYAELLRTLLEDSETYIAILEWRQGFLRKKILRSVCGSETALVGRDETKPRAVLLIPDWEHLTEMRLTVFYKDESVLTVNLGSGDRVKIAKPGGGEAARRLHQARRTVSKRGWHPDLLLLWIIAAILWLAGTVGVINAWAVGVPLIALGFLPLLLVVGPATGTGLHPRPSRFGAAWAAMGWGVEDVRRLVTAVIGGVFILLIGIWLGQK